MRRGTTSQLILKLSEPLDMDRFYVTFKQCGNVILEKTETDCTVDGQVITVPLSQEDTLKMKAGGATPVRVQIRALIGETAIATSISQFTVADVLKEGVIPDD